MTGTCAQVVAKALHFNSITSATSSADGTWPSSGVSKLTLTQENYALGGLTSMGDWNPSGMTLSMPPTDPLMVVPYVDPNTAGTTYTLPRVVAQLVGKDAKDAALTATVCVPQTTFLRNQDSTYSVSHFFFDTTGTPYSDIFLTKPAMTGTCAESMAKGLKATSVEQAIGTMTIDPSHGIYLYNKGQLQGVIDGQTWTAKNNNESPRDYVPLTMALGGGTGTDVVNVPQITVTLKYNQKQTLNMCFPAAKSVSPAKYIVYYDTTGKPYKDIFLTQPIVCNDYDNIHIISTTTTSAVIGWSTPRTTCSRINYGTVANQLNSKPVAETAPCTNVAHQAMLTGLTPGAHYLYEIVGGGSIVSGQQVFTTSTKTSGGGVPVPVQIPADQ